MFVAPALQGHWEFEPGDGATSSRVSAIYASFVRLCGLGGCHDNLKHRYSEANPIRFKAASIAFLSAVARADDFYESPKLVENGLRGEGTGALPANGQHSIAIVDGTRWALHGLCLSDHAAGTT